jgi:hypothetical protein
MEKNNQINSNSNSYEAVLFEDTNSRLRTSQDEFEGKEIKVGVIVTSK